MLEMPDSERSTDLFAWQPWARLNLYRNPFGELSIEERAELAVVDPEQFANFRFGKGEAVEFIGECGRGKSTRLRWLQSRTVGSVYVYLPEDGPIPAIPSGEPLIIDEAQRLSQHVRRRVFSTGVSVVLGTHRSLARVLRRHGYTVRTVEIGGKNTPELVVNILNRRIEASRLRSGSIPVVSLEDARRLSRRFGSDIRAMEDFLYERMQNRIAMAVDIARPRTAAN